MHIDKLVSGARYCFVHLSDHSLKHRYSSFKAFRTFFLLRPLFFLPCSPLPLYGGLVSCSSSSTPFKHNNATMRFPATFPTFPLFSWVDEFIWLVAILYVLLLLLLLSTNYFYLICIPWQGTIDVWSLDLATGVDQSCPNWEPPPSDTLSSSSITVAPYLYGVAFAGPNESIYVQSGDRGTTEMDNMVIYNTSSASWHQAGMYPCVCEYLWMVG